MIELEKLQSDLKVLTMRKDEIHQAFHQVCGAIDVLQQYIKSLTEAKKQEEEGECAPICRTGTLTEVDNCED